MNYRDTVYRMVYDVLIEEKKADKVLYRVPNEKDRDIIKRCSFGTIERAITLEEVLKKYSEIPVKKIDDEVRILLLMALFEMTYMDSIPDYAAINETVSLYERIAVSSGTYGRGKNTGKINAGKNYINAVLRSAAGDIEAGIDIYEGFSDEKIYAMPNELWRHLEGTYGKKTAKKIAGAFLEKEGETTLHIDTSLISTEKY